jgi:hypothetical protein
VTRNIVIAFGLVAGLVVLGYHFAPESPPGSSDELSGPSVVEHFPVPKARVLPLALETVEAT